jgi:hypothetical protein
MVPGFVSNPTLSTKAVCAGIPHHARCFRLSTSVRGVLTGRGGLFPATSGTAQDQLSAPERAPLLLVQEIPLPNVGGRIDHFTFDAKRKRVIGAALGNNTVEVVDTFQFRFMASTGVNTLVTMLPSSAPLLHGTLSSPARQRCFPCVALRLQIARASNSERDPASHQGIGRRQVGTQRACAFQNRMSRLSLMYS